jgi:hypothetical protein
MSSTNDKPDSPLWLKQLGIGLLGVGIGAAIGAGTGMWWMMGVLGGVFGGFSALLGRGRG